ncbi:Acetylcholine receptor subunit alpha-like [Nymphon striatum]|nr:Acetylcholine receptor subunit alpha-like [Nymphon striatum]
MVSVGQNGPRTHGAKRSGVCFAPDGDRFTRRKSPVLPRINEPCIFRNFKLSAINIICITINLKNQIMTTNLWVEQCALHRFLDRFQNANKVVTFLLCLSPENKIYSFFDSIFQLKFLSSEYVSWVSRDYFHYNEYWHDYKLHWNPQEYGGVRTLHIPSDHMWRPDILLYNNADGNFEVTLSTKAALHYNGDIAWKPPAIYKSSCDIDVEYFPFDEQTCKMKFGSWSYDGFKCLRPGYWKIVISTDYIMFKRALCSHLGSFFLYCVILCSILCYIPNVILIIFRIFQVDLRHKNEIKGIPLIEFGIDMSEFYTSVEWDILAIPAMRHEVYYSCCEHPFIDITFNITMRRKTLFYTVNLIIPCMAISFLTILVFYLPSESGEKVTLSISILLSLTVFFLLLAEIIPPTSLVVPLLGKYLLFTMILVTLSIFVTVAVLNVHFRAPSTNRVAPWVKKVFLEMLPPLLCIKRPESDDDEEPDDDADKVLNRTCNGTHFRDASTTTTANGAAFLDTLSPEIDGHKTTFYSPPFARRKSFEEFSYGVGGSASNSDQIRRTSFFGATKAIKGIGYIAQQIRRDNCYSRPRLCDNIGCELLLYITIFGPYLEKCALANSASSMQSLMAEDLDLMLIIVQEDWKYVAMVLDRLFLWIFTIACIAGTCGIILQAPTLYDDRKAINYDDIVMLIPAEQPVVSSLRQNLISGANRMILGRIEAEVLASKNRAYF